LAKTEKGEGDGGQETVDRELNNSLQSVKLQVAFQNERMKSQEPKTPEE
jgi:hypothetical protein